MIEKIKLRPNFVHNFETPKNNFVTTGVSPPDESPDCVVKLHFLIV